MAGDWIKVETTMPDKPEIFQMAEHLGIDPDAVAGKLLRVWIWADQQTVDGNAPSVTKALLDRSTGVTGFTEAMIACGWLLKEGGGYAFPNFDRHNGKTAKRRAQNAKRVQAHRAGCNADRNAESVTNALPEKRREESINSPPAQAPEQKFDEQIVDPELAGPAFREAWHRWVRWVDSQNDRPMDFARAERDLMECSRRGRDKAIRDIEFTIAKDGSRRLLDSDLDFDRKDRTATGQSPNARRRGVRSVAELLGKDDG